MSTRVLIGINALALSLALAGCSNMPVGNSSVPQPDKAVDIKSYTGLWYEIGRYDNGFEAGCEGVTAQYSALEGDKIRVVNTCHTGAPKGRIKVTTGKAKIVPNSQNAKLKVSFFGPLYLGNYWVLDHADDYSWSIVGEPSGKYLWLLSRNPTPSEAMRSEIEGRAKSLGYNMALLKQTQQ